MFATISAMADYDDRAFMLDLYREYYGLVRKTVFRLADDAGNLEDLINDSFIKLIEKTSLLRTFDSCRLAAYVVYTSRSVAINYLRRRDVRSKHISIFEDVGAAEGVIHDEDSLEDIVINQHELKEMWAAILLLPDRHKDLLYFKYILEMDDAAIAQVLMISPASVRQYLTRARRAARELMDEGVNADAQ